MTTGTSRGGGIYVDEYARLSVVNCTIVENKAAAASSVGGGGICLESMPNSDSLTIENSILWGNQTGSSEDAAAQIGVEDDNWNDRVINGSCVQGLEAVRFEPRFGLDCIWDDPKFKPTSGTLALDSDSPCIDTGNSFVDADALTPGFQALAETDLVGAPRIVDGDNDGITDVDMGAYEYQP
jgi:hypothetical protein